MAARSVYTPSRREQWKYVLKAWVPGSLIGLFGVGAVVVAFWIIPNREAADVRGAITRHGSGVVTLFTYGFIDQAGQRSPDQVYIALNGNQVSYSGTRFLLLRRGQRVQVTYRTGRSGSIYINDIKPRGRDESRPRRLSQGQLNDAVADSRGARLFALPCRARSALGGACRAKPLLAGRHPGVRLPVGRIRRRDRAASWSGDGPVAGGR